MEATVSKRQTLLCDHRNSGRCHPNVQPGLACAAVAMEDHRFCLGLQLGLDDFAGRSQAGGLRCFGSDALLEKNAFPTDPSPDDHAYGPMMT